MHCQLGKTPKIVPFPLDCVTPPEEDRAKAIGNRNMHTKFSKDLADRQTDTQTCSLQYFAAGPVGEVIILSFDIP